jgi:hypothetical protein
MIWTDREGYLTSAGIVAPLCSFIGIFGSLCTHKCDRKVGLAMFNKIKYIVSNDFSDDSDT